ncbi:phage holin family protein [Nocardioides ginkgobilobae]
MTTTPAGTSATDVPTPRGAEDERSLGEIVQALTQDTTTLLKQELELAKVELKAEATRAGKGAGMLGGAGLAGYLVLLFLSFTLMFGLDTVLPLWAAALITAGVWAVVAALLAVTGRTALKKANPQLPKTQQTLKEDAQWARAQKS